MLAMLFLFFFFLFFLLILFTKLFKIQNKNDELTRNWPLIGMLPTFVLNLHRLPDKLTEVLSRSKGTMELHSGVLFGNMKVLATSDPANVRHITSARFWSYPKGTEAAELFDTLGVSLFNLDWEEWKHFRTIMHAYLTHKRTQKFMKNVISSNIKEGLVPFLDHVSKQDLVVDLADLFKRHLYDFACKMCTGFNPKALPVDSAADDDENSFVKAMDFAFEAILSRHFIPGYLWKLQRRLGIGREKKLRAAQKTMRDTVMKYMSMKRELLNQNEVLEEEEEEGGFDMLTCGLTENEVRGAQQYDDETIRDSAIAFIFGAQDTTSAALSWFFYLLSKNPLVEMKIREEIMARENLAAALKEGDRKWEVSVTEEVSKLTYLHAAMCETLRLYPPAPFITRICDAESDILPSGHRVNKKTKVLLSAYAMGRMVSTWGEDCFEFKPERWINGRGEIKLEPSNKFFVFSSGPRICLGKDMAFKIMKSVAAAVVFRYRIQVLDGPVVPAESSILHIKHGLFAKVHRRSV